MILKTIIITATPILINEAPNMFKAIREWLKPTPPIKIKRVVKKKRKPVDTTPITQEIYDYVHMVNKQRLLYNNTYPSKKHTLDWLVIECNYQMDLKKSRSVYMDILSGKRNKSTLPVGTPIITKE